MIQTQRLNLVPLTLKQLEIGLKSVKVLARELNIPIVENLFAGVVERAVRMKIKKMRAIDLSQHLWFTYWLIVISAENTGAGMIGFKGNPGTEGKVEVGYGIDPVFQGCGYTTEAVRALVTWAFTHPECKAITATKVLLDNFSSQKVLIKAGFTETGSDEEGISYVKLRD